MKNAKCLILCIVVLFLSQNLSAQPGMVSQSPYERSQEQRDLKRAQDRAASLYGDLDENGRIRQPPPDTGSYEPFEGSREKAKEKVEAAKAVALADVEEVNKKMTAPQAYLSKYPEYVSGKNSGIFRLFPNQNCGGGKIVDVKELERCGNLPQVLGFGSKMSFNLSDVPTNMVSSIGYLFAFPDLEYRDNKLYAGNSLTETLITEMGDLDLSKIDSKTSEIRFLTKWKKSSNRKEALLHRQAIANGINDNGRIYSASAPIKPDSVYALRSIAYYDKVKLFWHTDSIIAFKIVGQESDGSVIVIWKQLQKKGAPPLRNW